MEKVIIYPKVVVYKNLFNDINKYLNLIKQSELNEAKYYFEKWEDWYGFGSFMNIPMPDEEDLKDLNSQSNDIYEINQIDFIKKISQIFFDVTADYIKENSIILPNWVHGGISICKYDISPEHNKYAMHYHTDYRGADADSPGDKFAITCTIYLNDDYEGGGLKFLRDDNGDVVDYKPEAGDVVVFPSGDPLTGTSHYFHGVDKISKTNKYFIRCFWMYHFEGTDEWHQNLKKYGEEEWTKIYNEKVKESFKSGKWHKYLVDFNEKDPELDYSTPFFRKVNNDN